mgnify:CR=1 FL=1
MLLPYLELPVAIGYGEGQEEKIVKGFFQPSQISSYHEGFYDIGMFIYIDGQPTQIALSLDEYQAKIQAYWNLIATKQNVKQQLGVQK